MKIPTKAEVLKYVTTRRPYRRGTIRTFGVNGHNIPWQTRLLGGDNVFAEKRDPIKWQRTQSRIAWTAFRSLNQLALNKLSAASLKSKLVA